MELENGGAEGPGSSSLAIKGSLPGQGTGKAQGYGGRVRTGLQTPSTASMCPVPASLLCPELRQGAGQVQAQPFIHSESGRKHKAGRGRGLQMFTEEAAST